MRPAPFNGMDGELPFTPAREIVMTLRKQCAAGRYHGKQRKSQAF